MLRSNVAGLGAEPPMNQFEVKKYRCYLSLAIFGFDYGYDCSVGTQAVHRVCNTSYRRYAGIVNVYCL